MDKHNHGTPCMQTNRHEHTNAQPFKCLGSVRFFYKKIDSKDKKVIEQSGNTEDCIKAA